MKSKFKILSIVSLFVLILSIFSVSCFAFEFGKSFFLKEEVTQDEVVQYIGRDDLTGTFTVDGVYYSYVTVQYMGYVRITAYINPEEYLTLYDGDGLTDPSLEVVVHSCSDGLKNLFEVLERPGFSSPSFYDSIFDSISNAVFGEYSVLTSEQFLTLTLISTILSYALVLLPVLLVIGFVLRCFRL